MPVVSCWGTRECLRCKKWNRTWNSSPNRLQSTKLHSGSIWSFPARLSNTQPCTGTRSFSLLAVSISQSEARSGFWWNATPPNGFMSESSLGFWEAITRFLFFWLFSDLICILHTCSVSAPLFRTVSSCFITRQRRCKLSWSLRRVSFRICLS